MSKDKEGGGTTIIIKKINKVAGGHHGGAWKVAYADFVTAMMAFFLLLWLLSSAPQETLRGIAEYFTPTIGIRDEKGIGFQGGKSSSKTESNKEAEYADNQILYGAPSKGVLITPPEEKNKDDEADQKNFITMEQALKAAINQDKVLKDNAENIRINITPEGLEIMIVDTNNKPTFKPGTTELAPHAKLILERVAQMIKYMPNFISVTGYTTSARTGSYDAWELSSDRANSARQYLQKAGIDSDQIGKIGGKADRELLNTKDPNAPENIRLSIILMKNSINPLKDRNLASPTNLK
ncbi:MAG: OmpA family protein [Alphaproteobacteria bacterium]|nr:OmpA family protein [Alphaproteobacteria bacterium]OJV13695.1 MAG: hypothetical protein BGO27_00800 [Alphaproteobacteria bacterium 33-17]